MMSKMVENLFLFSHTVILTAQLPKLSIQHLFTFLLSQSSEVIYTSLVVALCAVLHALFAPEGI